MSIEHVAIWTPSLETLKDFYVERFGAQAGPRYDNPGKGFRSYFLHFAHGARLELMTRADVSGRGGNPLEPRAGFAHLAFSLGSRDAVDAHSERTRASGLPILDGPRRTGDGYYEYVTLDPDGNRLEVTI